MTLDDIEKNLTLTHTVFKKVIQDYSYERTTPSILSWKDYKPGILKKMYIKEFEELVNDRQYSILFKDSSFAQIYYEYRNDRMFKYRLCYYPIPVVRSIDKVELEDYFDEATNDLHTSYYYQLTEIFGEEVLFTNENHLRFDYDLTVLTHFKNHIQFSGANEVRLPLKFLLLPFTFIDFIVRNVFVEDYNQIITKPAFIGLKGNSTRYFELDALAQHDSLFIHKIGHP